MQLVFQRDSLCLVLLMQFKNYLTLRKPIYGTLVTNKIDFSYFINNEENNNSRILPVVTDFLTITDIIKMISQRYN